MWENVQLQFEKLPYALGSHVLLSLSALSVGIAISVPLGIFAARNKRWQGMTLAVASVIQTIPSLALLALMVIVMGGLIGFWPAFIALVLYSMLPVLRNTVTGILGVDPALVEAACGLGMTARQMLWKVQIPLAAPVIVAGIRTSTVWVVGIATLSTPVGASSLGDYIFSGLQTRNHVSTVFGCLFAALLAIMLDQLIRLIEYAVTVHKRGIGIGAAAAIVVFCGATTIPQMQILTSAVQIGAKTFTEQYILAQTITSKLQDADIPSYGRFSMGSTILFDALSKDTIDCYVDYSGTIWATLMKREDAASPPEVLDEVTWYLKEKYGVVCLGPLGFENAYALAMRREQAEELGIRTIEDLAQHGPNLSIAGDYEFFSRPEWEKLRDTYGLDFASKRSMDSTFMYEAVKNGQVDVISAFSSDGRILAYDLLVLKDPKYALPPYDAILLVAPQAAKSQKLLAALRPLVGAIDDDAMRWANGQVDLHRRAPEVVGKELLRRVTEEAK